MKTCTTVCIIFLDVKNFQYNVNMLQFERDNTCICGTDALDTHLNIFFNKR